MTATLTNPFALSDTPLVVSIDSKMVEAMDYYGGGSVPQVLKRLQNGGYNALFMPQFVDARIEAPDNSPLWKNENVFKDSYDSISIRVTGNTKQGNPVIVYSHYATSLSNPDILIELLSKVPTDTPQYSVYMPPEEFLNLVSRDGLQDEHGNRVVWVIDDNKLKNKYGIMPVAKALKHPETIPFLGGEDRAQKYLARHKQIYGKEIGIWPYVVDRSIENPQPKGTLLELGWYGGGVSGSPRIFGLKTTGPLLHNIGHFLGLEELLRKL